MRLIHQIKNPHSETDGNFSRDPSGPASSLEAAARTKPNKVTMSCAWSVPIRIRSSNWRFPTTRRANDSLRFKTNRFLRTDGAWKVEIIRQRAPSFAVHKNVREIKPDILVEILSIAGFSSASLLIYMNGHGAYAVACPQRSGVLMPKFGGLLY